MKRIYVASSLHNAERVQQFCRSFEAAGLEITYDWTHHGQVYTHDELRKYGEDELEGVLLADILFFVQPGRAGAHVELGIALAAHRLGHDKTIVILEEEPVEQKTFYHLDFVHKFSDEQEAINFILGRTNGNT